MTRSSGNMSAAWSTRAFRRRCRATRAAALPLRPARRVSRTLDLRRRGQYRHGEARSRQHLQSHRARAGDVVLRAADRVDLHAALALLRRRGPDEPAERLLRRLDHASRGDARDGAPDAERALWNLYGQTEIAPLATMLGPEDQLRKPGSCGKPVLNVETRVVDDAMRDVGRERSARSCIARRI